MGGDEEWKGGEAVAIDAPSHPENQCPALHIYVSALYRSRSSYAQTAGRRL